MNFLGFNRPSSEILTACALTWSAVLAFALGFKSPWSSCRLLEEVAVPKTLEALSSSDILVIAEGATKNEVRQHGAKKLRMSDYLRWYELQT